LPPSLTEHLTETLEGTPTMNAPRKRRRSEVHARKLRVRIAIRKARKLKARVSLSALEG
jgi:hypothetical protein